MNGRELIKTLRDGGRVYGTMIVSTSPHWPSAVKGAGADFVFIDTEHIAIDRTTLAWMCQTYRALGLAPIVRIPSPDPYLATVALDNGASGVLAPYVETPEQARRLRGAVKLRPLKGQLLEEVLNGERELDPALRQYRRAKRCAENVCSSISKARRRSPASMKFSPCPILTQCRLAPTTSRAASARPNNTPIRCLRTPS